MLPTVTGSVTANVISSEPKLKLALPESENLPTFTFVLGEKVISVPNDISPIVQAKSELTEKLLVRVRLSTKLPVVFELLSAIFNPAELPLLST